MQMHWKAEYQAKQVSKSEQNKCFSKRALGQFQDLTDEEMTQNQFTKTCPKPLLVQQLFENQKGCI